MSLFWLQKLYISQQTTKPVNYTVYYQVLNIPLLPATRTKKLTKLVHTSIFSINIWVILCKQCVEYFAIVYLGELCLLWFLFHMIRDHLFYTIFLNVARVCLIWVDHESQDICLGSFPKIKKLVSQGLRNLTYSSSKTYWIYDPNFLCFGWGLGAISRSAQG